MNFILLSLLCETDDNSLNLIVDCLGSCFLALINKITNGFGFTPTMIEYFDIIFFIFTTVVNNMPNCVYHTHQRLSSILVLFNLVF